MALGNNMRIDKTRKKTGSPANDGELPNASSKESKSVSKVHPKLVKHGNENITCQIETIGTAPESEAHIRLSGQLIINYLNNVIDPIRAAVKQHERVRLSLHDIAELDLSCLQLLRTVQMSCRQQDIPCVVEGTLSEEQKALIHCAGFLEIFDNQTVPNG